MKEAQFVREHEPLWRQLENGGADADYPAAYRRVCHHLALARRRGYSLPLIERLEQLVIDGRQTLYRRPGHLLKSLARFYAVGFPAMVRRHARLVAVSALLFLGSLALMTLLAQWLPDLPYSVVPPMDMAEVEDMYAPGQTQRLGRDAADSDILMFGFYIRNNTGIGFRTFAGGLAFGLGSLFFLLFNGVYIGAIAGHLTQIGYNRTFWGFVAGHSAMELTAIVLCGAAGLLLGLALIRPGRRSRLHALRENAADAVRIVYGAATMFVIAAFIEAFWSSRATPPLALKIGVGLTLWALVILYFTLQGRRHAD